MKQISSFAIMYLDGATRISFIYNVIDPDTGAIISENNRGNFVVVDEGVMGNIVSIQNFIKNWMEKNPDLVKQ